MRHETQVVMQTAFRFTETQMRHALQDWVEKSMVIQDPFHRVVEVRPLSDGGCVLVMERTEKTVPNSESGVSPKHSV